MFYKEIKDIIFLLQLVWISRKHANLKNRNLFIGYSTCLVIYGWTLKETFTETTGFNFHTLILPTIILYSANLIRFVLDNLLTKYPLSASPLFETIVQKSK